MTTATIANKTKICLIVWMMKFYFNQYNLRLSPHLNFFFLYRTNVSPNCTCSKASTRLQVDCCHARRIFLRFEFKKLWGKVFCSFLLSIELCKCLISKGKESFHSNFSFFRVRSFDLSPVRLFFGKRYFFELNWTIEWDIYIPFPWILWSIFPFKFFFSKNTSKGSNFPFVLSFTTQIKDFGIEIWKRINSFWSIILFCIVWKVVFLNFFKSQSWWKFQKRKKTSTFCLLWGIVVIFSFLFNCQIFPIRI